jgi:UDP-3-O-[3-hydroxymyristoyl] glucosamine N-acyltransferase
MTSTSRIHPLALVEAASVGDGCVVHAFAVVRAGAQLGRNVVLHPHCVIEDGVVLGDNVEVFPGAYIGKEPKGAGALARLPQFERRVTIGRDCSIGPHAVVYYDVDIDEGCLIGDAASIREQCRIGTRSVIGRHVTLNYAVVVGNRVRIMDHAWLAGNMRIGDGAFISGLVGTANDNAIGRTGYVDEDMRGPDIGAGAAIGVGAILLPGISIAENAVVGAGAVVTRDVGAGERVFGMPARAATTKE